MGRRLINLSVNHVAIGLSCPTGALTAKDTKEYRKWETQKFLQLVRIVDRLSDEFTR